MSIPNTLLAAARAEAARLHKQELDILSTASEEDLHFSQNGANSIATLVQHIHGIHVRRWSNFFESRNPAPGENDFLDKKLSKEELSLLVAEGWALVGTALSGLHESDLERSILFRGEPQPALTVLIRQLDHFSHHVGQIALLGRIAAGRAEGKAKQASV